MLTPNFSCKGNAMRDNAYYNLIVICFFVGIILGIIENCKKPKYVIKRRR